MKLFFFSVFCLLCTFSAAQQNSEDVLITGVFSDSGVSGTFVLYDLNTGQYYSNDFDRANKGFLPASTFKIFNSLLFLEENIIQDEEEIITWDSIPRGWDMWDKDHNLRSAIKYSAVWFYQTLARRITKEKMEHYLNLSGYGNMDISAGIDLFWLEGNFKVTPVGQIEFLKKLHFKDLPFSERTINIVKDIMVREHNDNYILRGKTGWAARVNPQTGWYVGYVEKKDNVYFFAMNMDIAKNEDAKKREELTLTLLKKLNIIN